MQQETQAGRILLAQPATEAVSKMIATLKNENAFIKISPSNLASWILVRYFESMFEKEKGVIAKTHFNPKEYLKDVIRGMDSNTDVTAILESALDKTKTKSVKKGSKLPNKLSASE